MQPLEFILIYTKSKEVIETDGGNEASDDNVQHRRIGNPSTINISSNNTTYAEVSNLELVSQSMPVFVRLEQVQAAVPGILTPR